MSTDSPISSEPRTRSTSGRVKWTISGPVTMHVDPQSGATVIEYEAEAAEPAALDVERLGRAMECHVAERVRLKEDHTCERDCGPLIATEYARLQSPDR